jgi:hypothetical protein
MSTPANPEDGGAWLKDQRGAVSLALGLLPFAGIGFLWFMGVVRDRIGHLEDQFSRPCFLAAA